MDYHNRDNKESKTDYHNRENKKRNRGKNYTDKEKEELLGIIEKYVSIVENKKTDTTTNRKKYDIWEKITQEFNTLQTSGIRTSYQIKNLYEAIKKKAKKDQADEKADLIKMEPGLQKHMDSISERLLHMIGNNISDISNDYESDSSGNDLLDTNSLENIQENTVNNSCDISIDSTKSDDQIILGNSIYNHDLDHIHPSTATVDDLYSLKRKRKYITYEEEKASILARQEEMHKVKIEILKIRKEREEIKRDKEILEKEKLLLEVEEKRLELEVKKRTVYCF